MTEQFLVNKYLIYPGWPLIEINKDWINRTKGLNLRF